MILNGVEDVARVSPSSLCELNQVPCPPQPIVETLILLFSPRYELLKLFFLLSPYQLFCLYYADSSFILIITLLEAIYLFVIVKSLSCVRLFVTPCTVQRKFKLLHSCTPFTCQEGHAQNFSSQASTVCEPRTSRCTNLVQKRQRNQRSNCRYPLYHRKNKRISVKHLLLLH